MPEAALTPELALEQLGRFSSEVRAAVLLDRRRSLAGHSGVPEATAGSLRGLVLELFERADAAGAGAPVAQVEVSTAGGSVFAVRGTGLEAPRRVPEWTLAVVADRLSLSSLMFYDLRSVLAGLASTRA